MDCHRLNRREPSNLNMMNEIWTDMELKRLIFAVTLHPEIYDIKYKSPNGDKIWREIAEEFEAKTGTFPFSFFNYYINPII